MSKKRFCQDITNMTETEKGIMARSVKLGQDQINFLREQQAKENLESKQDSEPKQEPEEE